ncbi:MAG TPA: ATP-dependent 6-phosphofructokinase [Vicinamibacterales bacterium]|nr:ATP-dependent 6-phosphofructokinase [Vicinamibacterales bacterium]
MSAEERSGVRRIGVLTGGGDAPGLNAVIRAVVKAASSCNCEVIGLEDSFDGLIESDRWRRLVPKDVRGILRVGGTILGTTNRGNPFLYPIETSGGLKDYSARCVEMFHELKLDALIVIGGDGTLAIAHRFSQMGIPLVGVPKTIDNDIVETTNTFGFDTAVSFATDAIDRLHVTAEAHHRVIVVEVMGRYAGWIALYSGVAGGADVILIPEIPYDVEKIARRIRDRDHMGARFSIVVAAEGAKPIGGTATLLKAAEGAFVERLGGVAALLANDLERLTGKETRSVVLGHLQRGGAPTSFDRTLATRFGARAVELLMEGTFDHMVAFHPPDIVAVPLEKIVGRTRTVPLDFDVIRTARLMGISLGN